MSGTMQQSIYRAALEYGYRGWKVVPLSGPNDTGTSPGKRPLVKAWQQVASSDEEVIAEWWERWPDANVGVKFGPDSNLVDLECDDAEQELALAALFDGEFPRTPTFTSARGKHRLFLWNDNLPAARDKAVVYVGGVGFRTGGSAKGAQSVFPPSVHKSGARYEWLIHPDETEVAEIPEIVIAKIANNIEDGGLFGQKKQVGGKPQEYWDKIITQGVAEGEGPGRNQTAAELIGKMLSETRDPFDAGAINRIWTLVSNWNCLNQPPLPAKELDTIFKSILRREREAGKDREYGEVFARYVDTPPARTREVVSEDGKTVVKPEQPADSETTSTWKIVQVDSKPVIWRLYSPLWTGPVELDSDSLMTYRKITLQVLEQKKVLLEPKFKAFWHGTKNCEGMASKLTRIADVVESAPEQHRDVVLADVILNILSRCPDHSEPEQRGSPTRLGDGSIWLKITQFHNLLRMEFDSVNFGELSSLLLRTGAEDARHRFGKVVNTFKVLSPKTLSALEKIARRGEDVVK